jgi:Ca-activated chloride channel family protein
MKKIMFIFAVTLTPCLVQAQYFDIRKGNSLFEKEQYDEAKALYEKALKEKPNLPEASFNSGSVDYRKKSFLDAAKVYSDVAENATDNKIRSQAYYNAANAYYKQSELPEVTANPEQKKQLLQQSVANYKKSLAMNPADRDAKENLEFTKALLKQTEQQQKDKDNKSDNKQQDKNKDKNEDKKKDDQQKDKDKQNKDSKNQNDKQNDKNQQNKNDQQPEKEEAGKISKEQAERMLDALRTDEKDILKKYQQRKTSTKKLEKDW